MTLLAFQEAFLMLFALSRHPFRSMSLVPGQGSVQRCSTCSADDCAIMPPPSHEGRPSCSLNFYGGAVDTFRRCLHSVDEVLLP